MSEPQLPLPADYLPIPSATVCPCTDHQKTWSSAYFVQISLDGCLLSGLPPFDGLLAHIVQLGNCHYAMVTQKSCTHVGSLYFANLCKIARRLTTEVTWVRHFRPVQWRVAGCLCMIVGHGGRVLVHLARLVVICYGDPAVAACERYNNKAEGDASHPRPLLGSPLGCASVSTVYHKQVTRLAGERKCGRLSQTPQAPCKKNTHWMSTLYWAIRLIGMNNKTWLYCLITSIWRVIAPQVLR